MQRFPNSKHMDITTVNNDGLPRTWNEERWERQRARIRKGCMSVLTLTGNKILNKKTFWKKK